MQVVLELHGLTGLVQHNERLADPTDDFARGMAGITKKPGKQRTESENLELSHIEFLGGLYFDPDLGVYIPAWNVVRALEDGAKITREGTAVVRAISVLSDKVPLLYDGPRQPEELWKNPVFRFRKMVGLQKQRVARMRPIFRRWKLRMEAELLDDVLNPSALERVAQTSGRAVGLGDARKLGYGRFDAVLHVNGNGRK